MTCGLGTMSSGSSATITIVVGIPAAFANGTITNSATIAPTANDPVPGNNTASASTTVTRRADLQITKTDAPIPWSRASNSPTR